MTSHKKESKVEKKRKWGLVHNKVPKTVGDVEFYGEIHAFKLCEVPCVISYSCEYCVLEISLGNIVVPSSVDR